MNRIKYAFAAALVALTLSADARASIGGTDPEPPIRRPGSKLSLPVMIQIAFSAFAL